MDVRPQGATWHWGTQSVLNSKIRPQWHLVTRVGFIASSKFGQVGLVGEHCVIQHSILDVNDFTWNLFHVGFLCFLDAVVLNLGDRFGFQFPSDHLGNVSHPTLLFHPFEAVLGGKCIKEPPAEGFVVLLSLSVFFLCKSTLLLHVVLGHIRGDDLDLRSFLCASPWTGADLLAGSWLALGQSSCHLHLCFESWKFGLKPSIPLSESQQVEAEEIDFL